MWRNIRLKNLETCFEGIKSPNTEYFTEDCDGIRVGRKVQRLDLILASRSKTVISLRKFKDVKESVEHEGNSFNNEEYIV